MVKKSMINCELKCEVIVVKYVVKCVELKVVIVNVNVSDEECFEVMMKF